MDNDFLSQPSDSRTARHAAPGGVHTVKNIVRHRRTIQKLECFKSRAASARNSEIIEALSLVHGTAAPGDFSKRFSRHRIIATDINAHLLGATNIILLVD